MPMTPKIEHSYKYKDREEAGKGSFDRRDSKGDKYRPNDGEKCTEV